MSRKTVKIAIIGRKVIKVMKIDGITYKNARILLKTWKLNNFSKKNFTYESSSGKAF